MKYLKTWMGVTTGTYMGRDDGYPERKCAIIETLDQLVKTYDPKAEYFRLESVDVSAAVQSYKDLAAPSAQAEQAKCPTCKGDGGWERANSSTSYTWVKCPDCKPWQAEQKGGAA